MHIDSIIFFAVSASFAVVVCRNFKGNAVQWLLWPCIEAERILGSGTGQAKLRSVYDAFMQQFPILKYLLPFSVFSLWVDEALVEMRRQIETNPNIAAHVSSGTNTAA